MKPNITLGVILSLGGFILLFRTPQRGYDTRFMRLLYLSAGVFSVSLGGYLITIDP